MGSLIKNEKDFYAGVLFCALGTAFAVGAIDYEVGSAANMGAGYFPLLLGVLLSLLGLIVTLNALRGAHKPDEQVGPIAWKPLIVVILANLAFGICLSGIRIQDTQIIPQLGLLVGVFLLVVISSLAEEKIHWLKVLVLAIALSIISYMTFIVFLKLRIPVFPAW